MHIEIQLQIIGCNLATMPASIKTKKCVGKLCIWRPGHSYVCPLHVHFIFAGVRKFRDFFDFGLHCSLRVSLILLYFISTRAWVENLHIKNCIKNLMIVMPSYFTRTIGTRLCEEGHFSNILKIQTSQYPLLSFTLDYGQGYTQGYGHE